MAETGELEGAADVYQHIVSQKFQLASRSLRLISVRCAKEGYWDLVDLWLNLLQRPDAEEPVHTFFINRLQGLRELQGLPLLTRLGSTPKYPIIPESK